MALRPSDSSAPEPLLDEPSTITSSADRFPSPRSVATSPSFSVGADAASESTSVEPGFTRPLLSRLSSSRAKFESWIEAQRSRADDARRTHEELVAREREEVLRMEGELRRVRGLIGTPDDGNVGGEAEGEGSAERRMSKLREQMEEIERSIADLHLGRRERERELDEAEREESVQRSRADEVMERRRAVEEVRSTTIEDLTVGQVKYHHLGLTFQKSDAGLRFAFAQIDPADPRREFTFELGVNLEDRWEVDECSPPLRAGSIIRLIDELNDTGEIGGFVRGMRKEFKAMI